MSNIPRVSPKDVVESLLAAFPGPATDLPPSVRDLTLSQIRLLYMLRRDGPKAMGSIADLYGVGHAGATGIVRRIERHGLIERRHRADDRRMVDCDLTQAGKDLLADLAGLHRESLERTLAVLAPDELGDLDRLLRNIATRSQETQ